MTIQKVRSGTLESAAPRLSTVRLRVFTIMRYWSAALIFLMLGFIPSLRAELTIQKIATTGRIITISAANRTMIVSGALPLRTGKMARRKRTSEVKNTDEYTVVATGDTVFQDGADTIKFEDFKSGETISIHGVLNGTTLTASRLAKWE